MRKFPNLQYVMQRLNLFSTFILFQNFCEKDASSKYKGQLELAITNYDAKYAKQQMQQAS